MPAADSPFEVRCAKCQLWFSAPVFVGGNRVFDKESLIGSFISCPKCGSRVSCTIDTVRDRLVEEEDLVAKYREFHRQSPSSPPHSPAHSPSAASEASDSEAPAAAAGSSAARTAAAADPDHSPAAQSAAPARPPATPPPPTPRPGKGAHGPDLAVEVRCGECRRWFSAPIRVGKEWILSKEAILGAYLPCGLCGARVACTIDNVRERGHEEDRLGPVLGL